MRFDELAPEAGRAVREAARRVQRPEITTIRAWHRRRNGLAVGLTAFIGAVAVVGAVALWPNAGGSPPAAPPATTTAVDAVPRVALEPPADAGLTVEDSLATPVSVVLERTVDGVTWRLAERGSSVGRCLELTAIVDGSVHSRGGGCSFSPDPTAGAWDLARPLRFSIGDSPIITLFGRAGVDVAGIRIAESPGSIATDVRGVWLIVTKATDSSVFIESFDGDGENLLSEQVPISAVDASILDVEGLIAELRIARATVNRLPREAGGDGPPFFAGEASAICLNGRQVRLYEYPSRADRDRDSISITKEGQIERPGTLIIAEWVGPPHFFAGGRIIVLHLGEDQDILTLLTNILGPTLSPDGVGSRGTGDLPCDDEP